MTNKIVVPSDYEGTSVPREQIFSSSRFPQRKDDEAAITSVKFQKYQPVFDVINIAACIAVVVLHVNGAVWNFSYGRYWATSLILECVFYGRFLYFLCCLAQRSWIIANDTIPEPFSNDVFPKH